VGAASFAPSGSPSNCREASVHPLRIRAVMLSLELGALANNHIPAPKRSASPGATYP